MMILLLVSCSLLLYLVGEIATEVNPLQPSRRSCRIGSKKLTSKPPNPDCDTRFKIAGQWWGIPVVMKSSTTKTLQIVSSTQASPNADIPASIVFKMKRAWTPRLSPRTFDVNHFVTLSLEKAAEEDGEGPGERIKYHKDQWSDKDYSHGGLGKVLKTVNGDTATVATRPPKDL